MTAAGIDHAPAAAPAAGRRAPAAGARLVWLFLASRRTPAAAWLLAGLGMLMWASLHWHWNIAGGAAARQVIPLTIEAGSAAVIAVSTYGPFGEPERATGRWLPWLRMAAALLLTGAAFGALCAGATAGVLPGGSLALLRNVGGMTGTGLLAAAVLGGAFGWAGPIAYLLVTEVSLSGHPTTPWVWPARPPHDLGGALCASAVFAAGVSAIMLLGARETGRDSPGPLSRWIS